MRAGEDAGKGWGGRRGFPSRSSLRGLALIASCLVSAAAGCRGLGKPDKRYDLLTAELRTRERELLEARAELAQYRLLADTYQRQGTPCDLSPCGPAFHPASTSPALPVRDIALANGTGGIDDDGLPGDEALQIVLVPRDADGSPVKTPGTLRVSAYDVTPSGLKAPIGRWEVPPDQLRKAWRNGLFSTGYFVPLQWDQLPSRGKVRLVARFTTLDGQEFETDKDVTVKPLAEAGSTPSIPTTPPPSGPNIPPTEVPELPPPPGLRGNPTSRPSDSVEELPLPAATLGTIKALP